MSDGEERDELGWHVIAGSAKTRSADSPASQWANAEHEGAES